jgi:hypothetical protein
MRVIIAGSRDFTNYQFLVDSIYQLNYSEWTEIVSGGAKGADTLGEQFAMSHKIPLTVFIADWKRYGNAAGPIRNNQMAENADMLVAFWDGKSKGTKNMIETAQKLGLKTEVIKI